MHAAVMIHHPQQVPCYLGDPALNACSLTQCITSWAGIFLCDDSRLTNVFFQCSPSFFPLILPVVVCSSSNDNKKSWLYTSIVYFKFSYNCMLCFLSKCSLFHNLTYYKYSFETIFYFFQILRDCTKYDLLFMMSNCQKIFNVYIVHSTF